MATPIGSLGASVVIALAGGRHYHLRNFQIPVTAVAGPTGNVDVTLEGVEQHIIDALRATADEIATTTDRSTTP